MGVAPNASSRLPALIDCMYPLDRLEIHSHPWGTIPAILFDSLRGLFGIQPFD